MDGLKKQVKVMEWRLRFLVLKRQKGGWVSLSLNHLLFTSCPKGLLAKRHHHSKLSILRRGCSAQLRDVLFMQCSGARLNRGGTGRKTFRAISLRKRSNKGAL